MDVPSLEAEELIHIPEHHKVTETLGWQPGIWGAFFLVVGCLFAFECKWPLKILEWEIIGILAVPGFVLVGYEIWRRRNRTVLVKESGRILVFRKGGLDITVAPEEVRREEADLSVMLKIAIPLGLCMIGFTAIGIIDLIRERAADAGTLSMLSLGITCGLSLASAVWTRYFRCNLRVPVRGSKWLAEETVLVTPAQLKELFPVSEGFKGCC